MSTEAFAQFKAGQREGWTEVSTAVPAANLVRFAKIVDGARVLDVATGTGVVAVTAARIGARVTGLDLTPDLLERARRRPSHRRLQPASHHLEFGETRASCARASAMR